MNCQCEVQSRKDGNVAVIGCKPYERTRPNATIVGCAASQTHSNQIMESQIQIPYLLCCEVTQRARGLISLRIGVTSCKQGRPNRKVPELLAVGVTLSGVRSAGRTPPKIRAADEQSSNGISQAPPPIIEQVQSRTELFGM